MYEVEDTGPTIAPAAPLAPPSLIVLKYLDSTHSKFKYMVKYQYLFIKNSTKHDISKLVKNLCLNFFNLWNELGINIYGMN